MTEPVDRYQPLTPGEVQDTARGYFAARVGKTSAPETPSYVLVGGQPGAGKSSAAQMVRDELAAQGGYIHIDADRMREQIDTRGTRPASHETQADAGKLVAELRKETLAARRNALEEGTFRDTLAAVTFVQARRADGYRVELVAVATPQAESLLGIYQRHEQQHLSGSHNPRFVPQEYHDAAMRGFEKSLALVAPMVDRARVITRDGEVLYDSARQVNEHQTAAAALKAGQQLKPDRLAAVQNGWALVGELARSRGADSSYVNAIRENASTAARHDPGRAADNAGAAAAVLRLAAQHGIKPQEAAPTPAKAPDKDRGPSR